MGASSAIESILAMEGMRRGVLLPTINHRPDPEIALDCVAEGARTPGSGVCPEERLRFRGLQRLSCVSPRRPDMRIHRMKAPQNRRVFVIGYGAATPAGADLCRDVGAGRPRRGGLPEGDPLPGRVRLRRGRGDPGLGSPGARFRRCQGGVQLERRLRHPHHGGLPRGPGPCRPADGRRNRPPDGLSDRFGHQRRRRLPDGRWSISRRRAP